MRKMIIGAGAVASALIALGTTITYFSDVVPRPVFEPDLRPLHERLAANEAFSLQQALETTELRLLQMKQTADDYRQNGQPVPAWLTQQIRIMERRVQEYEHAIKEKQQ